MLVRTFLNAQFAVSSMLGISRSTGSFGVVCPLLRDQDTLENIAHQNASPGPTLLAEGFPHSSLFNNDGIVSSPEQASLDDLIPNKLGLEMLHEHQQFLKTWRNPSLQHGGRPLQDPQVSSPEAITPPEVKGSILKERPHAQSSSTPPPTMLNDALLQIERQLMDDEDHAGIQAVLPRYSPQEKNVRGVSSKKRPLDSLSPEVGEPDNGNQNSNRFKRPYTVDAREEQLAQEYPSLNLLERHNPPWSSSADQANPNAATRQSPGSSRSIGHLREPEQLMATQAVRHTASGPITTSRTMHSEKNILPHLNEQRQHELIMID